MENILYSTHCPACSMVENKLKEKGIPYTLCEDREKMIALGFKVVPQFYCAEQDKILTAQQTLLWANKK